MDCAIDSFNQAYKRIERCDYVAIHDAFRAARRKLEDHGRRERQDVKSHIEPDSRISTREANGATARLMGDRNSVLDAESLAVGDEVRFHEEPGLKGPQATSVARICEHGHHETPQL